MEEAINTPTLRDQIVFFIKQTRAMAGMTRAELAGYLGTNKETVRNWERQLIVPRADMFLAIMELRRKILRARRGPRKEDPK